MICPRCESYVSENMAFCPFCGHKINPDLAKSPVNKPAGSTLDSDSRLFGQNRVEDQDFGHIPSAIDSPHTEDSYDFSEKMKNAFSEIAPDNALQEQSGQETPDVGGDFILDIPENQENREVFSGIEDGAAGFVPVTGNAEETAEPEEQPPGDNYEEQLQAVSESAAFSDGPVYSGDHSDNNVPGVTPMDESQSYYREAESILNMMDEDLTAKAAAIYAPQQPDDQPAGDAASEDDETFEEAVAGVQSDIGAVIPEEAGEYPEDGYVPQMFDFPERPAESDAEASFGAENDVSEEIFSDSAHEQQQNTYKYEAKAAPDDEYITDEYEIKRNYFPEDYPVFDYDSLPASEVYRERQKSAGPEYAGRNGINGPDEYDSGFPGDFDQGPDILSDIRHEEELEDSSTFSVADTFKKAKDGIASIFKKKGDARQDKASVRGGKSKAAVPEKPFVVTIRDDEMPYADEEPAQAAPVVNEPAQSDEPEILPWKKPAFKPVQQKKTAGRVFSGNKKRSAAPGKKTGIKKFLPLFAVLFAALVLVVLIVTLFKGSGGGYKKQLFPEVYFDNGKVVLLKSERPEDKHNIASSGVENADSVHYFSKAGLVYYVKNSDLYCYTLNRLEFMRIVRNVFKYDFFDNGRKLCAVSTDGRVYYFNGKDITALSKGNDPVKPNGLPYVISGKGEYAVYLDDYNTAAGSAVIYRIDAGGKSRAIIAAPESTANIELIQGRYIMLTGKDKTGTLYDIDGTEIASFDNYTSCTEVGKQSILVSYNNGAYAFFDTREINDLTADIAEIVSISEVSDRFCYKSSDGMCYAYDNGNTVSVCDTSVYSAFGCDIDKNTAYGLENDILYYYNISGKVKSAQVSDGITGFAKDEQSGIWFAMGESSVFRLDSEKCIEIYGEALRSYPVASSGGKSYLLINNAGELIKINGAGSELVIAENVLCFDSDSSFSNVLFVSGDKLYLNGMENRVTTVRESSTFSFTERE